MAFNVNWNCVPYNILVQIFSYLSPASRAIASTTCKTWHEAYFSPSLWNDIQLCYDPSRGWDLSKQFTTCCGRAFRKVSIFPILFRLDMFDTHGFLRQNAAEWYVKSVQELLDVLDLMSISQELHCLQIKFPDDVMGSWADDFDMEFFPAETLERIWQSISTILKTSRSIESLKLGFHINILGNNNKLQLLKDTCANTLKVLHCMVLDLTFDGEHPCVQPSIEHLNAFKKLREINLNISYVTDDLLEAMSSPDHCQLERIGILSTCIEKAIDNETWTTDAKWCQLKAHSPGLVVSMCLYWPGINVCQYVLKPVIPIHKLSIMCDDESLSTMFGNYVTTHFKDTLVHLELHSCTMLPLFDHRTTMSLGVQPLLVIVGQCQRLKKLVITGFKILYDDIIAIAERRKNLDILDIAHDCIVYLDLSIENDTAAVHWWMDNRDEGNEDTQEGQRNRSLRNTHKVELIDRVSQCFHKRWTPMNLGTSALSFWSFLDGDILPYKENTDDDSIHEDQSEEDEGSSGDCERGLNDVVLHVASSDNKDTGYQNKVDANQGAKGRIKMYQRYIHAMNLAPCSSVAYKVRTQVHAT